MKVSLEFTSAEVLEMVFSNPEAFTEFIRKVTNLKVQPTDITVEGFTLKGSVAEEEEGGCSCGCSYDSSMFHAFYMAYDLNFRNKPVDAIKAIRKFLNIELKTAKKLRDCLAAENFVEAEKIVADSGSGLTLIGLLVHMSR
jgi:ribosomal protein L7/L12